MTDFDTEFEKLACTIAEDAAMSKTDVIYTAPNDLRIVGFWFADTSIFVRLSDGTVARVQQ